MPRQSSSVRKTLSANANKSYEQQYKALLQSFEAVAHAASHQLKDPLRQAILNLEAMQQQTPSFQAGDTIGAINLVIRRIELIREFSFLVANKHKRVGVDCNKLLSKAVSKLKPLISERKALVTAEHLPVLMGKEEQLLVLFSHVIENGITYNRSPVPKVHITAKEKTSVWEFAVLDNGIGLEEVYREFVFSFFQSLDPTYSTHGAGLTFCRQIVQNHGGKIWFEPQETGTCFYFTLAK